MSDDDKDNENDSDNDNDGLLMIRREQIYGFVSQSKHLVTIYVGQVLREVLLSCFWNITSCRSSF